MRTLLTLLLLAPLAAADEGAPAQSARIVTLDGRVIDGTRLLPRGGALEIATAAGPVKVEFGDVLEASTGTAPATSGTGVPGGVQIEASLLNGDLLRGTLIRGIGEKAFILRTAALGEVEVPLALVAAVRFPAGYARAEDPPALAPAPKADRFLFVTGDRVDGTLRSLGPDGVRLRTISGEDRALPVADLLGFALLPLKPTTAAGLAVRVALADGTRISCAEVKDTGPGWLLVGTLDGKDRAVPAVQVAGLSVSGGRGSALSDLAPAAVEVKPYWGEDPLVEGLKPVVDRAFTLDRGPPPPLRLGGRTWLRGLSMFSGTSVHFDLEGKGFKSFLAAVGVDDAGPLGAVEFEVLVDGKSAWRSGPVKALAAGGEPLAMAKVSVDGAKRLTLVVHAGANDDVQDFADWVRAALIP